MELLLNEKSLDGQFTNLDDFYEVLPVMSSNLRISTGCVRKSV